MQDRNCEKLTNLANRMEKTKMEGTKISCDSPAVCKAHSEMQKMSLLERVWACPHKIN